MPVLELEKVDEEVAVGEEAESTRQEATIPAPADQSATSVLQRERRRSSVTKPPKKGRGKNKQKQKNKQRADEALLEVATQAETAAPPTISRPPPMTSTLTRPLPLLTCSVGNPGAQYANTLHSAGHTVLNKLAAHLGGYTQFSKDKSMGNGLVSRGSGDWTLWQSTAYMNESGKGVRAAYTTWNKTLADSEGRLVIVHDELEKPLGAVSLRTAQGLSAKGHNGIKSILAQLGNTPFARIGIGIGRPMSRQSDDVARYVLRKMDANEKTAVEGCVEEVVKKLRLLEMGKG